MLHDVAERLVAAGHDVVVLTTSGGYVDSEAEFSTSNLPRFDIRVVRKSGSLPKVISWGWFLLNALLRVPFMRWDRCLLLTDPPFLVVVASFARLFHGSSRRIFWWTMDLYPDALGAAGLLRLKSSRYRVLQLLSESGLQAVDGVVTLGLRQRLRLKQYRQWKESDGFSIVVPPWDNRPLPRPAADVDHLQQRLDWKGLKIALYAGNLGEGHSFAEFVSAARLLSTLGRKDWLFVFAVRGSRVGALRDEAAELPNVKVMDYLPEADTAALLWSATVHLISMQPGWEGIIVPSKLYGILQTKAPVLFVGPEDADTAYEIDKFRCGKALPPESDRTLVAAALDELGDLKREPVADTTGIFRVAAYLCAP
jgi:hypothetical protein